MKGSLLLTLLLAPVLLLAQVQVSGKVQTNEGDGLENATITIWRADRKFHELLTLKKGKYSFKVPVGHRYLIEVKKDYYATTRISISTEVPKHLEHRNDGKMFSFKADMNVPLLECREGMDPSVFEKPIKEIFFDKRNQTFAEDRKYAAMMAPGLKAYFADLKVKRAANAPMVLEEELLKPAENPPASTPAAKEGLGSNRYKVNTTSGSATAETTAAETTLPLSLGQQEKVANAQREATAKENQRAKAALQGELLEIAAQEKKQGTAVARKKEEPKADATLELKTAQADQSQQAAQQAAEAEHNQGVQADHLNDLLTLAAEEKRRKLRARQAGTQSQGQNLAERPEIVNYEAQDGDRYVWTTEMVFADHKEVYKNLKLANGAFHHSQNGTSISELVYTQALTRYR